MKRNIILLCSVIILTTVIGCRKSSVTYPPSNPSPQGNRWIVTTVAGDGIAAFADGQAPGARFRAPIDIAVTDDGIIYVSDAINHRIRKITQGQVSTVAGNDVQDTTSGVGVLAGFELPSYITFDKSGNLYTLDVEDPRVRKISPAGLVSVVAGNGSNGFADGKATIAQFGKECSGIAIDGNANIYVLDWRNKRLRKISADGNVTTLAGNGRQGFVDGNGDTAAFFDPGGLAIDAHGNLFAGDHYKIRKITPAGTVTTFAGKDSIGYRDGSPGTALFSDIGDVAIDSLGNIYVTDDNRIRKITPQGIVSTIAGRTGGYRDGDGTTAQFLNPVGLTTDRHGVIYVADDHNNRIRKISFE